MDRLSPQDAAFLHIEDDANHMHIASTAIFEGPAPGYAEFLAMVASKLHRVPRYRQKVRFVPMELGRPVWVDDPYFQLAYHVRHSALPRPGGDRELRNLVRRVMSQQLDRHKPLWEMWMVEGLEEGRWALISKTHHCMVDGVSGTDLLAVMLDHRPDEEHGAPVPWTPSPEPSGAQVVVEAVLERAINPYEAVRGLRSSVVRPRRLAGQVAQTARGLVALRELVGLGPRAASSLNGPVGPHRRYHWTRQELADVKAVRKVLGGTINDVVLTIITRGFRDLLIARGERLDQVVRTMVPVSVRSDDERGTYNNRVSAMFADLPVGIADPVERLYEMRRQMEGLKESRQAVAGDTLVGLSGFAPPLLLALGTRVASRLPQRSVQTVTTNVPGPQFPLYASGREMLTAYPYVPIGNSVRIGVAIFSYHGGVSFGVTGDYDSAPDIDVICRGIRLGMQELLEVVGAAGPGGNGRPGRAATGGGDVTPAVPLAASTNTGG